jgi:predicted outer membrane protein
MSNANRVKASWVAAIARHGIHVNDYAQTEGSGAPTTAKSATRRRAILYRRLGPALRRITIWRAATATSGRRQRTGLAEVELGRIAARKATDRQVKQFAAQG